MTKPKPLRRDVEVTIKARERQWTELGEPTPNPHLVITEHVDEQIIRWEHDGVEHEERVVWDACYRITHAPTGCVVPGTEDERLGVVRRLARRLAHLDWSSPNREVVAANGFTQVLGLEPVLP